MKFLSDHNVNICMKPMPYNAQAIFICMKYKINDREYGWANIVNSHGRYSVSRWFSIAAREIKRIYGLNS